MKNNIVSIWLKQLIHLIILSGVLMSCLNKKSSVIDLSGKWKFQIDNHDVGIQEKWFANNLSDTIHLPGSMPEQNKGIPVGYHTKFTGNTWKEYPEGKYWYDDENYKPFLSDDKFRYPFWLISDFYYVGSAWYQKNMKVPESWRGKSIELYLERPHWETKVWVNGKYAGLQNGLGVPHRYKVGALIQPGVNTITICVDNRVKDINVGVDAHSISDNTQTNWNGIVGEIKLVKRDKVFVSNVQIYPNIKDKTARLEVVLKNKSEKTQTGKLKLQAKTIYTDTPHEVNAVHADFDIDGATDTLVITYDMGDDVLLWDEFNPNVYELSVQLSTANSNDLWTGTFGMGDFRNVDKSLENNGRPVYLRGTLDCAVFPKTGYPPTDMASWERILNACKAHGLNHIRFHSWCPPKAAFNAADKLGFYYQVEASVWGTKL